jgi:hypothetical protein
VRRSGQCTRTRGQRRLLEMPKPRNPHFVAFGSARLPCLLGQRIVASGWGGTGDDGGDRVAQVTNEPGYRVLCSGYLAEHFPLASRIGNIPAGLEPAHHCGHVLDQRTEPAHHCPSCADQSCRDASQSDLLTQELTGNLRDLLHTDRPIPPDIDALPLHAGCVDGVGQIAGHVFGEREAEWDSRGAEPHQPALGEWITTHLDDHVEECAGP